MTTRASIEHKTAGGWVGEAWGGLASMLVALPSSIAFGVAIYAVLGPDYAGRGATAGMLGAAAMGLVAPLLGGAPRLISAPCAPAAAIMATLAAGLLARDPSGATRGLGPGDILIMLTLVGLFSGCLQLLYGAAGGGRLIKYIPYPVVSGYLSGVGLLIFLSQAPKFLGLPKGMSLAHGIFAPASWQWLGIVVGVVTIVGMVAGPRITKAVPGPILGLLAGMCAYFVLAQFHPELRTLTGNKLLIGPVAQATNGGSFFSDLMGLWRQLGGLRLAELERVLTPALTLSVLLSMDTLKTCVVLDALTRSRHASNRELIAQGTANVVSALVGGMPGAGTMGATLVNLNSGGRTRVSGVIEGLLVLVAMLVLGGLIGWVPIAALAGMLLVVGFRMLDRGSLHLMRQKSTVLDFAVIIAVVLVAVLYNLIAAAGVGLALAILLFIREQMRGSVIRRKVYGDQISSKRQRLPDEKAILVDYGSLTTVCELQGSLFFGTTDRLFSELEADIKRSRFLILDMRRVQSVDFTAAHLLEQIEAMLTERQAQLVFSSLPANLPSGQDLEAYFQHLGLVNSSRSARLFDSLDEALEWVEDRILEEAQLPRSEAEMALELPEIDLLREFEADQTLPALKACVQTRSFAAGEAIFKRGDRGDEIYLIRRGVVRILLPLESGKHVVLASFGRGNFFGDMAFLDRTGRSASAVASTQTDLYVVSRTDFDEVVRAHPLLGVKMFARLARALAIRLRHTDNELRALGDT